MAKRLDISALVELVGAIKLKKELLKDTWYYNIIENVHYGPQAILRHFEVPESQVFEYIIFNEPKISEFILREGVYLLGKVPKDIISDLPWDEKFRNIDYLHKMADFIKINNKIPPNWAEWLFETITEDILVGILSYDEFCTNNLLIIYDHKMRQVLPVIDNNITDRYLRQWFKK